MLISPHEITNRTARDRVEQSLRALQVLADPNSSGDEARRILARFAGAGTMVRLFSESVGAPQWEQEARLRLRELLSEDDYASLRNATLTAYYTPPELCISMWEGLRKAGFNGGKVLDPGCGATVNFWLFCPEDLRANIEYVGVEKDSLSCEIAKRLHPDARFYQGDFMTWPYPVEQFDLVIGNIPFDDGVKRGYGSFGFNVGLHTRIFLKSIDMLKPGGTLALITSTGTLDSTGASSEYQMARFYMEESAYFAGAVRLPQETFKRTYNTQVTADVIVMQKRATGDDRQSIGWINALPTGIISSKTGKPTAENKYFRLCPEHAIGDQVLDRLTGDKCARSLSEVDQILPKFVQAFESISNTLNFPRLVHQGQVQAEQEKPEESVKGAAEMSNVVSSRSPQSSSEPSSIAGWRKFTITYNEEKNGVEIRFPDKPSALIRKLVEEVEFPYEENGRKRRSGFRYAELDEQRRSDKRWYCRVHPSTFPAMLEFLKDLASRGVDVDMTDINILAAQMGVEVEVEAEAEAEQPGSKPKQEQVEGKGKIRHSEAQIPSAVEQVETPKPEIEPVSEKRPTATPKPQAKSPFDFSDLFGIVEQLCQEVVTQAEQFDAERNRIRQLIYSDLEQKLRIKPVPVTEYWLTACSAIAANTIYHAMLIVREMQQAEQSQTEVQPQPPQPQPEEESNVQPIDADPNELEIPEDKEDPIPADEEPETKASEPEPEPEDEGYRTRSVIVTNRIAQRSEDEEYKPRRVVTPVSLGKFRPLVEGRTD